MTVRGLGGLLLAGLAALAPAAEWPQWGGADGRNMVSPATNLPDVFDGGESRTDGAGLDPATATNLRWAARLGTQTCGTPVIAGGRVLVGTNNGHPRDGRLAGDRGVLMCFDEKTGAFQWQLVVSKLKHHANFNGDFAGLGVCSTPAVKDGRVYLTTSRCEALCLDLDGLADGNDGPFREEGEYIAAPVRCKTGLPPDGGYPEGAPRGPFAPLELLPTDADILWRYDFMEQLDVWPQDATDSSPLIVGNLVFFVTSNGVDQSHKRLPSPQAPSVIALDAKSGKLRAADDARIGPDIFHGEWSSPSLARSGRRTLVLHGGGDGFCHAFDANPAKGEGAGEVLREVWRCDVNPPEYRTRDGRKLPYNKNAEGPSEVIGTPVFDGGRVYVATGQDTRHGPGPAAFTCVDVAAGTGDVTRTAIRWQYKGLDRSMSTPSVWGGMVFIADLKGTIHCLDADTGALLWRHETKGQMLSSTLVADGRVFAGNSSGKVTVLAAAREARVLREFRLPGGAIQATPVAVGGTLYLATGGYLFAFASPL